uniref:Zinc finger protein CONSTANS-LIKE 14-like n=1 Tax=Nelumbo nucifera TaxID=4432 RepID=A0A822YDB6_NELNU|nr:TPA_asm: hypothetical protein HUJ06_009308 [Nelumbo nucifera]
MEKNPRLTNSEGIPCDFCNEQIAVLYCRADSAKLCLFCDHHVHSANALSRKHLRSQICDNCSSEPAPIRCSTDNLVLCQECDWDAHGNCSISASHERNPLESFSGCPSATELASVWGFDLGDKKSLMPLPPSQLSQDNHMFPSWSALDSVVSVDSWVYKYAPVTLHDLMSPNENGPPLYPSVPSAEIPALSKRQNSNCGKQTQVIFKQLVELLKRDLVSGDGVVDELGPGTPGRTTQPGNIEALDLPDGGDVVADTNQLLQQQTPFTSLLMLPARLDPRESNRLIEDNIMWDCNPTDQAAQIWDFNLGKSRNHEEAGPLEVRYGSSNAGFIIKSYNDLIKGTSLTAKKVVDDIYEMNWFMTHDDISSQNNNSNNLAASQGPTTSESNNIPVLRASSSSTLAKPKACGNSKDAHFLKQSLLVSSETARAATKADMEMVAQNRGNAMLRYKEKKKSRRYDKHIRYESRKARADARKRVKASEALNAERNS